MKPLRQESTELAFESFLPFAKPSLDEATIQEVVDSLRSGWLTTGPKVAKFEAMMKEYFQVPHALALTSATAGLYIIFQALEFEPGDEVITTPMTFAATLNVLVLNNLKPVLVDVDPKTYNMDLSQVEAKITPRTRAIMPVHFAGLPVDMDELYRLAEKHHLRVIEDAAHAVGASHKGKLIGSFGDIQVFSFHPNKNMTTGEGGAILTRDDQLAKKLALLRFHGMDREAWNRFGKSGSQHYQIIEPGHKFNMMDLQAALGVHQLPQLKGFNERRRTLAKRYFEGLKDIEALQLPADAPGHCWHLFAPLVKNGGRNQLMADLKERNIGSGLHYEAVHLYDYYQKTFGWKRGDFPMAEMIGDSIVSLPLFPLLENSQQDVVMEVLRELL